MTKVWQILIFHQYYFIWTTWLLKSLFFMVVQLFFLLNHLTFGGKEDMFSEYTVHASPSLPLHDVFAESSWWVDFDTYLLWVYFSRVFEGYDGKYFAISTYMKYVCTYVCNALCILWLSHGYKLIHTVISTKVSLDIKSW